MNCPECSGPVEPDQRFCNWCGIELSPAPTATPSVDEAPQQPAPPTADTTDRDDSDKPVVVFATPTGEPADQPPTLIIPVPPDLTGNERTALFTPDFTGRDAPGSSASADAPAESTATPEDTSSQTDAVGANIQPRPPEASAPPENTTEQATEAIPTHQPGDAGSDTEATTVIDSPSEAQSPQQPNAATTEAATEAADASASDGAGGANGAVAAPEMGGEPSSSGKGKETDDDQQDDQQDVDGADQGGHGDDSDATTELELPAETEGVAAVALVPSPEGTEGDSDSMWSPGYVAAQVVTAPAPPRLEAPLATPPATPYDLAAGASTTVNPRIDDTGSPTTMVMPATAAASPVRQRHGFRMSPLFIVSALGAIVAVAAMFFKMVEIASDVPLEVAADNPFGFTLGAWTAGDLAGNLPIAGIIVAVGMIGGAIFAGFGYRWGAGLAGGSGGAAVGVAMLALGLAQFPIDAAQRTVAVPSEQQYILSITRDVGYWLQVATAAIGLVALWASFADARADHRRSLNPWIAALGALATLVAAIGPMVPVGQGLVSDNWYLVNAIGEPSQLLIIARLVQIAIFALTGVVGFLIVSRYGLGLVFGGTLAAAWLTISTVLELTNNPVGFAFRNPGETVMQVHGVTIIGIAATLAAGLIACAAVLEQNARNR